MRLLHTVTIDDFKFLPNVQRARRQEAGGRGIKKKRVKNDFRKFNRHVGDLYCIVVSLFFRAEIIVGTPYVSVERSVGFE